VDGIDDLPGRRVNLGPRNSGSRATAARLLDALGIAEDDLADARALPMGAAVDQLCAGDLDAMLAVVGHPNAAIARALKECDTVLLPIAGPAIDAHLAGNPEYTATAIPRGTYEGQSRAVRSFSVTATLMTRAEVPPEVVGAVTRIIVETLPDLNRRAAVIPATRLPGIASDGLAAPLHEGAAPVLGP
jgi:TRAP transporter TAXI family solute receptor